MRKILFVAVLLLCAAPAFAVCTTNTLALWTESFPLLHVNEYVDFQIEAVGGTPPYTFTVTTLGDPLPPNLSLTSDGRLQGTPTVDGYFTIFIRLTDAEGCTFVQAFALEIDP
jgi:hypothetical protein